MKLLAKLLLIILPISWLISCSNGDNSSVDEEKPTISINYSEGFPQACEEIQKGQSYTFKAMVTDNMELAAYSLNIHHNFDHHTHDDQGAQCELSPIKNAVNPMIFMENHTIENGGTSYEINLTVAIPNDIDIGDYHCAFSVTDATGWQSRTSIDIKIVD